MRILNRMRKHTTIDLDTDLVAAAADVLGTRRTTETVHAALEEVVALRGRLRLLDFQPDLSLRDLAVSRQGRLADRPVDDVRRGA
jgi:Arc/MetJ family transcription regulator